MDINVEPLYRALNVCKNSIFQEIEKIDKNILDSINAAHNAQEEVQPTQNPIIEELLNVLPIFLRILYITEQLSIRTSTISHTESENQSQRQDSPNQQHDNSVGDSQMTPSFIGNVRIEEIIEEISELSSSETVTNDRVNSQKTDSKINTSDNKKPTDDEAEFLFETSSVRSETSSKDVANDAKCEKLIDLSDSDSNADNLIDITHEISQPFEETKSVFKKTETLESSKETDIQIDKVSDRIAFPKYEVSSFPALHPNTTANKSQSPLEDNAVSSTSPDLEDIALDTVHRNQSISTGSIWQKFLEMPVYDWREERVKSHEIPSLKKDLTWELVPKSELQPPPKENKPKERRIIMDIPDRELKVDETCVICHVESPSEFYVRNDQPGFVDFEERFNKDMDNTHRYVVNKFKSKAEVKDNLGRFCVGYDTDRRKWYRLEVINWMSDEEDEVVVKRLDYGEQMLWNCRYLNALPEFHATFSNMAIKCHLLGVCSSCTNEPQSWTSQDVCYFINTIEFGKSVEFLVTSVDLEGDSYSVDLRIANDPTSTNLSELLVDEDEVEDEIEVVAVGGDVSPDDSFEILSGEDCEDFQVISPSELVKAEIAIEREYLSTLTLPVPEQIIKVLVTGFINSCHFYVHILDNGTGEKVVDDDFHHLVETMQEEDVVQSYEMLDCAPRIGELVVFTHHSMWHRGRCVNIRNGELKIFLLDYGGHVEKQIDAIRKMEEKFLNVPFQAVECMLHNCEEIPTIERDRSLQFYNTVYSKTVFKARVVESGEPLMLQVFDDKNVDMAFILKQFGLVEEK